jgi:hypothetical protein
MAALLSTLQPHPDTPQPLVRALRAGAVRRPDTLVFEYQLSGELSRLSLPVPSASPSGSRRDGLWRHSCFEAFIARPGAPEYFEFNFAPQGDWAAYRFAGYRAGMEPLALPQAPRIEVRRSAEELLLTAAVSLNEASLLAHGAPLRVALASVIEDGGGTLSYWSLRHAPGKADFHHADGFALELNVAH